MAAQMFQCEVVICREKISPTIYYAKDQESGCPDQFKTHFLNQFKPFYYFIIFRYHIKESNEIKVKKTF